MKTREEQKRRRDAKCRHFNGAMNEKCDNGVGYPPADRLPCWGDNSDSTCGAYSPLTVEELVKKEADLQRHMDLMQKGLSDCCEAPFDTSRVITSGRFKNHGPRYCSRCHRLLFMV